MIKVLLRHQGLRADFDLKAIFAECLQDAYQFGSEAIDKLSDRFPRRR